jgi:multiple sugar transport system permease protein
VAIISNIDRLNPKGRMAMLAIYAVLFTGAISMLYPFLLMLRMTTADPIDQNSVSILPRFLWDENISARKYLLRQYRLTPGKLLPAAYATRDWTNLTQVDDFYDRHLAPFAALPPEKVAARVADYEAFKAGADPRFLLPLATHRPGQTFEDFFVIHWLSRREGVSPKTYQFFEPVRPDLSRRDWVPSFDKSWDQWREWSAQLPPSQRLAAASHSLWQAYLADKYRDKLPALRAAHGAAYPSFTDGPWFTPARPGPDSPAALRADWDDFVSARYPLFWQQLPPAVASARSPAWRAYLAEAVAIPDAAAWTRRTGLPADQGYAALPSTMPAEGAAARWWCAFVAGQIPAAERELLAPEADFAAFLRSRHGSLEALNAAWGSALPSWDALRFPQPEADYLVLRDHSAGILWSLTTANFRTVLRALVLEGRAFTNTGIILVLAVFTALTINPVAAYALSRFRVKGTHKILIFLLATLALPGEVAMVPGFLLVRDLHLIDTYWALILPSAANAFSIFLLKGFFDSLPQELYEAALMDGAGEFTLFTRITIPLSMPILAVTLLGTVTHAYNLFMPAVMYLGDTAKWPIATAIYKIGQTSQAGVGMAALVVSSIFPLLVFIFCQRIIMRGIILPSMK